ncbi:MAG: Rod shape-determining protein MreC [Frankiales bacterium]|nr:Rod shape-determining protein MreC [Frankiales bacterium]
MRGSRRVRLVFVLLLLTAFTLTALDYNTAKTGPLAALRRGIDTVFGPVQRVVGDAASSVGDALGGLPRLGKYQSENKKLVGENERLKATIASMAGLQCQVDQINGLMHFVDYTHFQTVPAHVVSLGPSSGFEWTATIDAGSKDGIKPSMTVIAYSGLLGRTVDVGAHTAKVLLIADPEFKVGGIIIGQSALGTAEGHGSRPMTYSLASSRSVVLKGDVLLTVGSDDTYAPGVPIGTVTSITPDANAISRTATIAPFVDVSAIDLVGVITERPRSAPRPPLKPVGVGPSPTSSACPSAFNHGPVPTPTVTPSPTTTPSARTTSSPSASSSSTRTRSPSPSASASASHSASPRASATVRPSATTTPSP